MKYYLYNPLANNGVKPDFIKEAENTPGMEVRELIDIIYPEFLNELAEGDEVVLVGGDGTINYFINAIEGYELKNKVITSLKGKRYKTKDILSRWEKYYGENDC